MASYLLVAGLVALAPADSGAQRLAAQSPAEPNAADVPTFSRDVAPVLYRNCVTCHRAGEIAPMSLITYAEARPWARAIRNKVIDGVMPPWHADAPAGTFENERRLSAAEKNILTRWADAGAPEGDSKDLPPVPQFADGWRIGTPDAVFAMDEDYAVPAKGTIEYEYFYIPTNFADTKWLQAIEVRPGNRALVHHVLVYYQAPPDEGFVSPLRPNPGHSRLPPQTTGNRPRREGPRRLLATYAPGTDPQVFRTGTAVRLPPGGGLELQLHYTSNGTAGTDRTKVGMIFAKEPPATQMRVSAFYNAQLSIPAGKPNHQVDTDVTFVEDALLWGLFPHTHVRGKRWSYSLILPDGSTKPLLSVPRYDFNWQTYYMFKEPLQVPKGARIVSSAWYDNSAANRSNPDPRIDVKWGDQTWEEMQYTGILYSARRSAQQTANSAAP
jgi:mono/diheme cytochrome c family protein